MATAEKILHGAATKPQLEGRVHYTVSVRQEGEVIYRVSAVTVLPQRRHFKNILWAVYGNSSGMWASRGGCGDHTERHHSWWQCVSLWSSTNLFVFLEIDLHFSDPQNLWFIGFFKTNPIKDLEKLVHTMLSSYVTWKHPQSCPVRSVKLDHHSSD